MTLIIAISRLLYYLKNNINSKKHTKTYPKIKDNMTNLMYNSYRVLR